MKFCLTDALIAAANAVNGKRLELIDAGQPGLVLRVTPGGVKSWAFLYRRSGDRRRRRVTFGIYPRIDLANARKQAERLQRMVAGGGDPAGDPPVRQTELSYALFADEYIELHAKTKKSSWARDREILDRDVIPAIGGMKLSEIGPADILVILDAVKNRGAPVQASRVLGIIRKSFNFAISRGHLAVNPCSGIAAQTLANRRERVLAPDEVKVLWERLGSAHMSWSTQQVLRLCLVTGQSVGDVSGAQKGEIDLDDAIWEIPPQRSTSGYLHRVPLSRLAVKLFSDAVRRSGQVDCVFPGKSGTNALTAHAVARAMRDNLEHFDFENVTPSDLKRTAAHGMRELGIARLTIAKALNHPSMDRSLRGHNVDKHEFEREKRIALDAWSLRVQEMTGQGLAPSRTFSPWRA